MKKFYLFIIFASVSLVILFTSLSKPQLHSLGELLLPGVLKSKEVKILFVGDMQFDRYVRQVSDKKGGDFIFSCISNFLKNSDLAVGNLEGPITDNASISLGTEEGSPDNFVFTFPPSTAKILSRNNIKAVSLDNNHIGNFGQEGILSTKKYLDKAGVDYFDYNAIFSTEINGVKMSFISYNEFGGESSEKIAEKISQEKAKGQIVFVYTHWGDEYSAVPTRIKRTASLFARNGADFIVGSHPHVILSSEKIGKTLVYYSLGNFIFDQYWNKEVSTGLALELNIKDGKIGTVEHKVSLLRDGRTCLKN